MTTAPITSSLPGKYLRSWNNPRKYHSGRGMNVASVGSAGPSIAGMPRQASANNAISTIDTTVTSRAVWAGKNAVAGP